MTHKMKLKTGKTFLAWIRSRKTFFYCITLTSPFPPPPPMDLSSIVFNSALLLDQAFRRYIEV